MYSLIVPLVNRLPKPSHRSNVPLRGPGSHPGPLSFALSCSSPESSQFFRFSGFRALQICLCVRIFPKSWAHSPQTHAQQGSPATGPTCPITAPRRQIGPGHDHTPWAAPGVRPGVQFSASLGQLGVCAATRVTVSGPGPVL